jgi:hypothetical protein
MRTSTLFSAAVLALSITLIHGQVTQGPAAP